MAVPTQKQMYRWGYVDEGANQCWVRMDLERAAAAGLNAPAAGAGKFVGKPRHVGLVNTDGSGQRSKLIVNPGNALYATLSGTVGFAGATWEVTGRIGEKASAAKVPG
jgi:hypothetical protein